MVKDKWIEREEWKKFFLFVEKVELEIEKFKIEEKFVFVGSFGV